MNNIPQKQNTPRALDLLAAQRQLYSDAKKFQMISMIIGVPVVIAWSLLVAIFPKLTVYAGFWGIGAVLLELLIFSRLQKSFQEKAAKVQQIFDCEVLGFNWDSLNCGIRVEPELITDASNRYKRQNGNYASLKDWYPISVEQLPIYQARIICQRANVWWDSKLRRRYSQLVFFAFIALTLAVVLIGLVGGLNLEKFFLAILIPLMPAFVLGLRQYTEHNEAADRLDRLKESAESLMQKVVSKKLTQQELETESYSFQTQIYDNRRRSPLIFDWLYSRLRRKDEQQMNRGAESIVQELLYNS